MHMCMPSSHLQKLHVRLVLMPDVAAWSRVVPWIVGSIQQPQQLCSSLPQTYVMLFTKLLQRVAVGSVICASNVMLLQRVMKHMVHIWLCGHGAYCGAGCSSPAV